MTKFTRQPSTINQRIQANSKDETQVASEENRTNFITGSAQVLKDAIAHRILLHLLKFLVFFAFQSDSPYLKDSHLD
ncbi:MAG: hypothetical protein NW220_18265 [Leptolyngbyaceae cyanobacterium bins.349]|nr:hypothetical protein [Leptolyngbyaceae cyanobacterium bins.349]